MEKKQTTGEMGEKKAAIMGGNKSNKGYATERQRYREELKLFLAPDHLQNAGVYVYVGKSGRGKTQMLKYNISLLIKTGYIQQGLAFIPTKVKNEWADYLPEHAIFETFDEKVLQKYFTNIKKKYEQDGKDSIKPSFVLFEDCAGVLTPNPSQFFINFLCTARHFKISIFITAQYLNSTVNTTFREQTTHGFMYRATTAKTLENLYLCFGQQFKKRQEFEDFLEENTTEPFSCVLYRAEVDKLSDNYTPIKAPHPDQIPAFKLEF